MKIGVDGVEDQTEVKKKKVKKQQDSKPELAIGGQPGHFGELCSLTPILLLAVGTPRMICYRLTG